MGAPALSTAHWFEGGNIPRKGVPTSAAPLGSVPKTATQGQTMSPVIGTRARMDSLRTRGRRWVSCIPDSRSSRSTPCNLPDYCSSPGSGSSNPAL